jgi:hypothetical protein
MDLADFCAAMERLFDAAGFGLNAGSEDTCSADVVQESAGTQRTIINILATGENKGWLAPVNIDNVLLMPIQSVTVDPISQALVPCTVKGPSGEDESRPTGTVMAEPIGSLTPVTCVPATLVEMDGEVLIPITNFGTRHLPRCRRFLDRRRCPPGQPQKPSAGTCRDTCSHSLKEVWLTCQTQLIA